MFYRKPEVKFIFLIILASLFTAVTTNMRGFFLRSKPVFWWTSINHYHGFSCVGLEKILSPFLEHSEEYVGVSAPFLQYFAAGSSTTSCRDYQEKEFVECFSEETQIIDIFTHCKLQPHKLSQSLATRLSSCQFWFLFDNMKNDKQ